MEERTRNAPDQPRAVLVGLDSMQGLQAARILAGHKVRVIAIAKDARYHSCRTRVCERIVIADTEGEELIATLEDIGRALPQRAVLCPCQDGNVVLVSRFRERLAPYFHMALPDHATVELLTDKVAFTEFALRQGLPVPPTRVLRNRDDAEQAAGEIGYPCLLKPSFRSAAWSAHTPLKAFKADDAVHLLECFDAYAHLAEAMIVQEWIEGSDTQLYSCNCYFDRNSRPLATFVARKLRQWPPRTGQSCLGEECRNDTVLDETLRLFTLLRFQGLGYLEMKEDSRTGRTYIIEPNIGRPTGRSAIAEAGGVELLYTMYCDLCGHPLPENRTQQYRGVKWIHLLRDLQSAAYYWRQGELSPGAWLRSVRGKKAYALFSIRDPLPFLAAALRGLTMSLPGPRRGKESVTKPNI